MLAEDFILSHTLLVYGQEDDGKRHENSNYTDRYSSHALGKSYYAEVWDTEVSRYVWGDGASFSTPLATIDAFTMAQTINKQTGKVPFYTNVKRSLLGE